MVAGAQNLPPDARSEQWSPRERISLNAGWRFHLGEPDSQASQLLYDVLPALEEAADNKTADAKPEERAKVDGSKNDVLKPWILPTGNAFVADPARRHVRPAGNPGSNVSFVRPDFDDSDWRSVELPHDWAIEGPFLVEGAHGGMGRLKSWGPVWYRKKLDIPASDQGRAIFLAVDGAMSYATVWLNGQLVGGWPYGYNSWRVDLTPHIVSGGANQLAIRLDNPPASARWYPGSGLYRNVWLTKTHRLHVDQWGTFIRTPEVSKASASVQLAVSIANQTAAEATVDVTTDIYALDADGRKQGRSVATIGKTSTRVAAKGSVKVSGATSISKPRLWGPR